MHGMFLSCWRGQASASRSNEEPPLLTTLASPLRFSPRLMNSFLHELPSLVSIIDMEDVESFMARITLDDSLLESCNESDSSPPPIYQSNLAASYYQQALGPSSNKGYISSHQLLHHLLLSSSPSLTQQKRGSPLDEKEAAPLSPRALLQDMLSTLKGHTSQPSASSSPQAAPCWKKVCQVSVPASMGGGEVELHSSMQSLLQQESPPP